MVGRAVVRIVSVIVGSSRQLLFRLSRADVTSRLGWPVPRSVKAVPAEEMAGLIHIAEMHYSRKSKGLPISSGWEYFLIPYYHEATPEPSWMCVVLAVEKPFRLGPGKRPTLHYGRLDVALEAFSRLPDAPSRQRDQLLHWAAWDAMSNSRSQQSGTG